MLRDMFKKTYTLIDTKYADKAEDSRSENGEEPNVPKGLNATNAAAQSTQRMLKIIIMSARSAAATSVSMHTDVLKCS